MFTFRAERPAGAELVEEGVAGDGGQTLIDRKHRVTAVPDRPEGGYEPRTGGEVDCHQVGHGR
jgi:hypothetical protein